MFKNSESLRIVHKIQEKIHEETKGMNAEEKVAYINQHADEVAQKYGLKLRKVSHIR